jgi:3-oxoacyl-[acyl-carrier-protein] synthase-3
MGAAAARQAMERAGIGGGEIDLVIVATATPDSAFPSTAARIQAAIGATRGAAFDIAAACTGFVYALGIADAMIRAGSARCALVIGTETYSRILDWTDRGTCVLFGDGAGAVVLTAGEGRGDSGDRGILSTHLHADGRHADILHIEGGAGSTGGPGLLRMAGKEVFRHAVAKLAAVVDEALAANGLGHADVRWLIPHQANLRIIEAMGKKLGLPAERVVVTVDRHANTSAASIPLALADAVGRGLITKGDLIVFEAIGGGLTWGAALARF